MWLHLPLGRLCTLGPVTLGPPQCVLKPTHPVRSGVGAITQAKNCTLSRKVGLIHAGRTHNALHSPQQWRHDGIHSRAERFGSNSPGRPSRCRHIQEPTTAPALVQGRRKCRQGNSGPSGEGDGLSAHAAHSRARRFSPSTQRCSTQARLASCLRSVLGRAL